MIYARLKGNINYFCTAMYSISINEQIVYATSNEYAAFAAYRSYCREFDNKPKTIILSDDGQRIHVKTAGQMLLEDVDKVTTNELLKIIMQQIDIDIKDIKAIVKDLDLPLSASQWAVGHCHQTTVATLKCTKTSWHCCYPICSNKTTKQLRSPT